MLNNHIQDLHVADMPLQSYKIKLVSEQFKFTTLYIYKTN